MANKLVSLDLFERLVYFRKYEEAISTLCNILEHIEGFGFDLMPDDGVLDVDPVHRASMLTRFVGAITSLIADPSFRLSEPLFLRLLACKRTLVSLFAATSFETMDHLMSLAGEPNEQGQFDIRGDSAFYKLMLASSIYSPPEIVKNTLETVPKHLKLPYWLSLLDTESVLSAEADSLRNDLLGQAQSLVKSPLPQTFLWKLASLWMLVSYFTSPDKHEAKKYLNEMLKAFLNKSGVNVPSLSARRDLQEKPTILVLSERFTSTHAMYRCYGPSIAQLKSRFKTVLVAREGTYDAKSSELFDEVVCLGTDEPVKKIVGKIIKSSPDVIFYPSLGMESWAIMLSTLRLAPIQLMTLGHPATSHSDAMDYVLIEELSLGDQDCFSETVLVKDEGAMFSPRDEEELPKPCIRENPELIRIAIPAVMYKLNSQFIQSCRRIAERTRRKVEFNFFPNKSGIKLDFTKQMIWRYLPDAKIHPSTSYSEYMELLGSCDIHLSTFPFGLTNGIVDSSLCALPMVALDGPEVHSHADVGYQRKLQLEDWLSAKTTEEFEDSAVRLIEDDELRVSISRALIDVNPRKVFFASEHPDADKLVNLMHWIYRNHERLSEDGRKLWLASDYKDYEDLMKID